MGRYAESTNVPVDKSRTDIERALKAHGATAFTYGWDDHQAVVMFEMANRRILFRLPMPDRNERRFTHTAVRRERRSPEQAEAAWEQAGGPARWKRRRWMATYGEGETVGAGVPTGSLADGDGAGVRSRLGVTVGCRDDGDIGPSGAGFSPRGAGVVLTGVRGRDGSTRGARPSCPYPDGDGEGVTPCAGWIGSARASIHPVATDSIPVRP